MAELLFLVKHNKACTLKKYVYNYYQPDKLEGKMKTIWYYIKEGFYFGCIISTGIAILLLDLAENI